MTKATVILKGRRGRLKSHNAGLVRSKVVKAIAFRPVTNLFPHIEILKDTMSEKECH